MSPSTLRSALAFSVLINLGVLAALGWQKLASDGLPMPSGAQTTLSRELQLSPGQLQRWHDAEAPFLALLHASGADIQKHRDELIQAIFSGDVDRARIDRAQASIADLQNRQQQLVIEQLLRERDILDAQQREKLAQLLMQDPIGPSGFERMHRE
ncbi:periplasmic heavy metal sensor [Serpens gallinarum]|uniref:Signaling pathway modulator ZraP n=1 Tax=Serpens gallinarum TaxID=2763075 RepID=A0ABR8TSP2_9PSED|nr:periplasmic heavy metal sensor [Serpens gallinarum]MBD7978788.1 periplasmic heavy metal sensor [Serpens gallinarum]